LKVSWKPSRTKGKISTYPQVHGFMVEKIAYKFFGTFLARFREVVSANEYGLHAVHGGRSI
jgi:hypothetical protein